MCPATVSTSVRVASCERSWFPPAPDRLRQPKVQHFHPALERDFDVGWFQIAVNDSFVVRGFQCFGDLARVLERLVEGQRPAQSLPLHPLQHQAIHIAGFFEASAGFKTIDGRDIGMVQGSQSTFRQRSGFMADFAV